MLYKLIQITNQWRVLDLIILFLIWRRYSLPPEEMKRKIEDPETMTQVRELGCCINRSQTSSSN